MIARYNCFQLFAFHTSLYIQLLFLEFRKNDHTTTDRTQPSTILLYVSKCDQQTVQIKPTFICIANIVCIITDLIYDLRALRKCFPTVSNCTYCDLAMRFS